MRISDWSSDVCSSDLATNGDGAIFFAILLHFRASGFGIGFMSRFMLKLAPDLVEFGLHHARRHFEVVIGRELVKQLALRSEEHTSELQSLMRISYAVFCLKKKKKKIERTKKYRIEHLHNKHNIRLRNKQENR